MINELLHVPYKLLQTFAICPPLSSCSNKRCGTIMYGSLMIALKELGLWPEAIADAMPCIVLDLAEKLSRIEDLNHESCDNAACAKSRDLKLA